MYCSHHPNKQAVGACVNCGKLFCEDCLVRIDDRFYCKEHAVQLINDYMPGKSEECEQYVVHHHVHNYDAYPYYPKSKVIALLLCIFFGYIGFHRIYVGKVGTGILFSLTAGLCIVGWILDLISIATNNFTDSHGMPLR